MSRVEAVQKMYNEIASQQSVDRFNVQIISVARIAKKDLTSRNLLQFLVSIAISFSEILILIFLFSLPFLCNNFLFLLLAPQHPLATPPQSAPAA